jgi:hypothetical protein
VTDVLIDGGRMLLGDEIGEASLTIVGNTMAAVDVVERHAVIRTMPAGFWCCRGSSTFTAMRSSGR